MTAFGVALDSCLDSCQGNPQSACLEYCREQLVDFIASVNFTGISVSHNNYHMYNYSTVDFYGP